MMSDDEANKRVIIFIVSMVVIISLVGFLFYGTG